MALTALGIASFLLQLVEFQLQATYYHPARLLLPNQERPTRKDFFPCKGSTATMHVNNMKTLHS